MFKAEDYATLEDLFYNNEDLSGYEVLQWLRIYHGRQHVEPHEIHTIVGLHGLWKKGLLRVIGNDVLMRKVEDN